MLLAHKEKVGSRQWCRWTYESLFKSLLYLLFHNFALWNNQGIRQGIISTFRDFSSRQQFNGTVPWLSISVEAEVSSVDNSHQHVTSKGSPLNSEECLASQVHFRMMSAVDPSSTWNVMSLICGTLTCIWRTGEEYFTRPCSVVFFLNIFYFLIMFLYE